MAFVCVPFSPAVHHCQFRRAECIGRRCREGKAHCAERCAPCHIVVPMPRRELSNSPPFDQIATRNDLNTEMLAYLILSPHPRMNMTLSREDADDLATYITSLRR